MDSKLVDPCCNPLNRGGLEGVSSWGCSGVSAVTGERSCGVSMREVWGLGIEGLDDIEEVVKG